MIVFCFDCVSFLVVCVRVCKKSNPTRTIMKTFFNSSNQLNDKCTQGRRRFSILQLEQIKPFDSKERNLSI